MPEIPVEYASERKDSRAQQAVLPIQSLADLDLRVLHRARSADLRSVRARLRLAHGAVARRRAGGHRHRRAARRAARRRAEAVHHPLHRGSAEPALSPRLLHVRVERGHHVRRAQHHRPRRRDRHRAVASEADVSRTRTFRSRARSGCSARSGKLPRVKPSTKGEGHERRYFYGSVWAVCCRAAGAVADVEGAAADARSATRSSWSIFIAILAFVGNLARLGRLPRTRPIVPGELAVSD